MSIYEQIIEICKKYNITHITTKEIKELLQREFGTSEGSILPSDFCYNRYNEGIKFDKHIFEYIKKGVYSYLGENYQYNGRIIHKPKGSKTEEVVGYWENGKKFMYKDKIKNI